jgi:ubiquitin-conjugating enzyme E2 D/E
MSSSKEKAVKRLISEYERLRNEPIARCTAEPKTQSDLFVWKAVIEGPPDTPYAGGNFNLEFTFPQDYPFKPPNVKMITKCYHPNIRDSHICVDILQSAWSPALGISQVLLSLSSLLSDPNPASPLNSEAAQLFVKNRRVYDATVRDWVRKYAADQKSVARKSLVAAAAVPSAAPVPPSVAPVVTAAKPLSHTGAKRVRLIHYFSPFFGEEPYRFCRRVKLMILPSIVLLQQ